MDKSTKIKIVVVLFIILMTGLIYIKFTSEKNENTNALTKIALIFEKITPNSYAKVNKYIVYGTHLNIEGEIEIPKVSGITISKIGMVIKNYDNKQENIELNYKYKDGILSFSTIKNINEGIDLENIEEDKYYVFVKILLSNNEERIYSLINNTEYENIEYYTITKNESNKFIDIKFNEYNGRKYMGIEVSKCEALPENVYDIVIDPGHGGVDKGVKSYGENEAEIVMDCAIILKEKLENNGYKVLLTRDQNMSDTEDTIYNSYDSNGRVTIANESHAKLLISLHMNNTAAKYSSGGVEVYAPGKCNLYFAKLLADNIVKTANTTYSSLKLYQKDEGVYVHNYSQTDITAATKTAERNGYEPYNITTDTSFLYILREIGGIATNAFVDGRNKEYSANKYLKSNVGIEGYSIDLGYMYIKKDLENVLNNKELYMQAICDTMKERNLND